MRHKTPRHTRVLSRLRTSRDLKSIARDCRPSWPPDSSPQSDEYFLRSEVGGRRLQAPRRYNPPEVTHPPRQAQRHACAGTAHARLLSRLRRAQVIFKIQHYIRLLIPISCLNSETQHRQEETKHTDASQSDRHERDEWTREDRQTDGQDRSGQERTGCDRMEHDKPRQERKDM